MPPVALSLHASFPFKDITLSYKNSNVETIENKAKAYNECIFETENEYF